MTECFRGTDIVSWLKHFGFFEDFHVLFEEQGIGDVDDLTIIIGDDQLRRQIEVKAKRLQYIKFLNALNKTYLTDSSTPILSDEALQSLKTPSKVNTVQIASHQSGVDSPTPSAENNINNAPESPVPYYYIQPNIPLLYPHPAYINPMPPYAPYNSFPVNMQQPHQQQAFVPYNVNVSAVNDNFFQEEYHRRVREENERIKQVRWEKKRSEAMKVMEKQLKHDMSIDIAFVLDCTGSMGDYIKAAREDISAFVERTRKLHTDITLRIAFVGYRDFTEDERIIIQDFTTDVETIKAALFSVEAQGGGDEAEDVLGGLKAAAACLDWRSKTRILYLVCDAPCHGTPFHDDNCTDNYSDGESNLAEAEDIFRMLRDLKILFFFGKICNKTDIMIKKFNDLVGSPAHYIKEFSIKSSTMIDLFVQILAGTLSSSFSASARIDEERVEAPIEPVNLVLDPTVPDFMTIPTEKVMKYPMNFPSSLDELLSEQVDRCVRDFPESAPLEVKLARTPFAKGGLRLAYCGQLFSFASNTPNIVFKECLPGSKSGKSKHDYEKFLICHRAARFFSDEFEKIRPAHCPQIHYVDAHIVQRNECWPEQPILIYEEAISCNFEKYNSNSGYVAPFPTEKGVNHEAVQAFSHWTHTVSKGCMIVVDCQGGYDAEQNKFLLTDPAVHCVDVKRFGRTNLGEKGFEKFYRSHVCNQYCKALGLIAPKYVVRK